MEEGLRQGVNALCGNGSALCAKPQAAGLTGIGVRRIIAFMHLFVM
jgi:hypothetical protein